MQPLHGIILAGGAGTRLRPLTNELNKHLLLVHDRPMIYFPLRTLAHSGVRRATIVTNARDIDMMRGAVSDPSTHGLESIEYIPQSETKGVAAALASAENNAAPQSSGGGYMVILGDNIFAGPLSEQADAYARKAAGAHLFLKHVDCTAELALAEIDDHRIQSIIEKPDPPRAGYTVTGAYLYDRTVFDRIRNLSPSARGELEITALNQSYLDDAQLAHSIIDRQWTDAGTPDGLAAAARFVENQFPPLLS